MRATLLFAVVCCLQCLVVTASPHPQQCTKSCFGENCDFWVQQWGLSCDLVESEYGCLCGGCACVDPQSLSVSSRSYGTRRAGEGSGSGSGAMPTPTPAPTSAPTFVSGFQIASTVKLAGVTSGQFDSTATLAFQQAIASKSYGSITVTSSQVSVTAPARRSAVTVSFTVYTGSSDITEVVTASSSLLSFLQDASSSGFATVLNTKASEAGSSLSTTGVTVTVVPYVATAAPTPAPTQNGEVILVREVSLANVSASTFKDLAQVAFKAAAVDTPFPSLSVALATSDIVLTTWGSTQSSRRSGTTYVSFNVYTGTTDTDAGNAASQALNAHLTSTSSAGFASKFNLLCEAFGLGIGTTGVTIVESTKSTGGASSGGLSAGAIAGIIIAVLVVLIIVGMLFYFCCVKQKHHPTDGTRVVKDRTGGDEVLAGNVPTMGSNDQVLEDKTVQI